MTLEGVALPGVETAGPDTSVEVLAHQMADGNVGSVIITEDDVPVGIVTARDLVVHCIEPGADLSKMTASDVMTPDPLTMHRDQGLFELTRTLCREQVRRMPIVDDDGEVVGIVTLEDLIALLIAELGDLACVINAESTWY